jgi:hypothetical protein
MEMSGQFYAPAALTPGKEPRYPLDRRLDGPRSRYGRCGEQKNIAPAEIQTPAIQPVAISTGLATHLHWKSNGNYMYHLL